ncbi:FadR/GntR family transcriptional regulator [Desulfogranum japonicum]|uniref:FadR/GntR family transcriptional regulator n=1 Tax=Desulfogranum japonicum TaxID=231447 RepID=UPI00040F3892|nr:FadR/GntR family transcriptional regulator [Desulfogranum japonicum]
MPVFAVNTPAVSDLASSEDSTSTGLASREQTVMTDPQSYTFLNNQTFKHPKVRWRVIEYLLHQMLDQSLRVHEPLPGITDLCDHLGVSRTAVREAINVLVAKGMVASRPGGGTYIQPLSSWMLLDPEVLCWLRESDMAMSIIEHLMEVRLIFEPEAAALASLRGTMEQFMAMNEALSRMSAGESLRTPESVQGDIDFHNLILNTSGNIFLARLRDLCMVSVELVVRLTFERVESVAVSIKNHRRLLDAITSRQPDLARNEAKRVLGKTVQDLQQLNIPFRRDILQQLGGEEE